MDDLKTIMDDHSIDMSGNIEAELGIIAWPAFWPDACGHGGYICSFEYQEQKLDLYIFHNPFPSGKQSACLRYGKEAPLYYSFHDVPILFQIAEYDPLLRLVIRILKHKGQFIWKQNE